MGAILDVNGVVEHMLPEIFRWSSLKTRIATTTLLIFLFSLWLLAFYASRELRNDMQEMISGQQTSAVSFVASGISEDIAERFVSLRSLAVAVAPALRKKQITKIETVLDRYDYLQKLFNTGLVVFNSEGVVLADYPMSFDRAGRNFLDRDYVAAALSGENSIGSFHRTRKKKNVEFSMAVPVFDDVSGKVIGVVSGKIDLSKHNFLDKITRSHYGQTDGYELLLPDHEVVIAASDNRQIEVKAHRARSYELVEGTVEVNEGTFVNYNAREIEVLSSTVKIPSLAWFVKISMPTSEVFSPIVAMQQRMFLATILLTLLAAGLTFFVLRQQFSPLLLASRKLTQLTGSAASLEELPVVRNDEIGNLIGGFNQLLASLKERDTALRESESRFRSFVENINDVLFALTPTGIFTYVSPQWHDASGYETDEAIGRYFVDFVHPEDVPACDSFLKKALESGERQSGVQFRLIRKDGSSVWYTAKGSTVIDPEKNSVFFVGVGRDVSQQRQMEEKVRQLAFTDALTGLPNRRLLSDRLLQAMASGKRTKCHGALLFMDLDNFKSLNDTHGHEYGDLLLLEAVKRLKSCVRETDTVARFGGDEFVVMLRDLHSDDTESVSQAWMVAEKIRSALSLPYLLRKDEESDPVSHRCTASIGVALSYAQNLSSDELMKRADAAMYAAKRSGRNRIRFHEMPELPAGRSDPLNS